MPIMINVKRNEEPIFTTRIGVSETSKINIKIFAKGNISVAKKNNSTEKIKK